ncbi:hypothetical protein [Rahnella aceris]|uniref:hypothetical protein n=1 Tax=Rahnella sp. (strain Y9602) TaxID=2703885 RepID=UPI001C25FA89|nr:hypothetical protein [Rahnella aceris]MBU9866826.1 hypothetical protein [Rahnella aceris]
MHRIDTSTSQKDKFGPGKNGFTGGNPQTGIPATALNAAFFDSVQEEISGVIESAGIALDPDKNDQLKTAISMIVTGAMPEVPVTSVNTKTGEVVLSATDVGAVAKVNGEEPDGSGNVVINIPAAPVTSVNTKIGAVVLKATDVGAVAKVNNMSPDENGNVNITIPSSDVTYGPIGSNQYALSTDGVVRIIGINNISCLNNATVTVTLARAFPSSIIAVSGAFAGTGGNDIDSYWSVTPINSGSFTLRTQNCTGTWSFVVMGI